MDQALKSLIASEEEVVTSLGLSRQWHLFPPGVCPQLSVSGCCLSPAAGIRGWGWGCGFQAHCSHSHLSALLFSPPPFPPPHWATPTVPPPCTFTFHPGTHPCSKCGDLEEELKIVTNNLKSLEAQADKVEGAGQ